ncbi:DEAD/DEAH box helicase [Jeotgalibaca ciconiae]|uniref:DEAD-box ATP-dependent RNA helicase CshB n=1 Tax=Jeotgalibaca ciconiae TaxID=2496265 RepID=A0A3S9HD39_9LACT|nr:DEAD/DEAH box helicase [Jeotgalibaca ciconiae]AZP05251.1 DEAD/DEAH box helicase [Jeotgalibaca ciconiae]HJB22997.1 DEAD/DEAH box helicase [Candidatus Jeotgalibaca pullicola]
MNFKQYNFQSFIMEAIEELGFKEPTEIQQRIIPIIQSNKSVVGRSQTGSGKSHSFLLPILNKIDPTKDEVQAIITAPSRELAEQLYQVAAQIVAKAPTEIRVTNYVGGTDKKRQLAKLENNQPHVVIGTPGRILDLVNEQGLKVHTAGILVVDEADMTLDLGFLHDVDQIAGRLPRELQMLVFSATIPQKLQPFLMKYMEKPQIINLEPKDVIAPTITNYLLPTKGQTKIKVLEDVLSIGQQYFTLVFANTKQNVNEIANALKEKGYDCAVLHGDIPARERKRIMRRVHNLEYQLMIATDLAARGIDIEGVSHVINYEIPKDSDFFVHRIGRTGRKDLAGTAITLYSPDEEKSVNELERIGIQFQTVRIKDGGFEEIDDRRNRQRKNTKSQTEVDPRIRGMVKKAKKKVKPNYKKKLNEQIKRQSKTNRGSDFNRKKKK